MSLYELQQEIKQVMLYQDEALEEATENFSKLRYYRGLVFNTASKFLAKVYPLTYKILKTNWKPIVREYLKTHPATSPIFNESARNFPIFLKEKGFEPSYLPELAWYEWLELEIFLLADELEEVQEEQIKLCPAHIIANFNYPITRIVEELKGDNLSFNPQEKLEQIFIYRDETDFQVRFLLLNPVSALVLEALSEGLSRDEVLNYLASKLEIGKESLDELAASMDSMLLDLRDKNIVLS